MAKIYRSIEELIGRTPLVELSNLEKKLELKARLLAKVEALNPGGTLQVTVEEQGGLISGLLLEGPAEVIREYREL